MMFKRKINDTANITKRLI